MTETRSPLKVLRSARRVGARRRALLVEACVWLLVSRLALIFIPFPKLAGRLGAFVPPADPRVAAAAAPGSPEAVALAKEVSWAVVRGAAHVPFRAVCLPQAMAAQIMLRRRGVACVMHFGAQRGQHRPLDAHAWLDAAGVKVTGYPIGRGMTEIACFV
ncbi:MAG TPA: lasso peptide biosynthesis B2 protein [Caulobacteraceae bacterium]